MSWISNLSITLSTAVIFFWVGLAIVGLICNGSWEKGKMNWRGYDKENYYRWLIVFCWVLFNIWQWKVLR
jgi:hypothetical protein